jgi:hypothetical protein
MIVPSWAGLPFGGPQAARGQQSVQAHQPQHALATDRAAAMSEPRAHFPIAFAMRKELCG